MKMRSSKYLEEHKTAKPLYRNCIESKRCIKSGEEFQLSHEPLHLQGNNSEQPITIFKGKKNQVITQKHPESPQCVPLCQTNDLRFYLGYKRKSYNKYIS